uniref:Basic salivary proline-rich protein 4 n=1 Tax=Castor canadensis TaxID=51338 RepID=A0A8B7VPK0_CASCN|nr:basic salivary proline-rich protein 4 [Castor canadensis]
MACYRRRGGKRAGKGLGRGVGCRDVSLLHAGRGGGRKERGTLNPNKSAHGPGSTPGHPHVSRRGQKTANSPNTPSPSPRVPCKGQAGFAGSSDPSLGTARGERQRCPVFYISGSEGRGHCVRGHGEKMGLCLDTSESWKVGDTMSSFSPTPGPAPPDRLPQARPQQTRSARGRGWLWPWPRRLPGLPSSRPSRRPGPRAAAPDTSGGGRGSQRTDRRHDPPQPRLGRPAPLAPSGAGWGSPPLTHPGVRRLLHLLLLLLLPPLGRGSGSGSARRRQQRRPRERLRRLENAHARSTQAPPPDQPPPLRVRVGGVSAPPCSRRSGVGLKEPRGKGRRLAGVTVLDRSRVQDGGRG